MGRLQHGKWTTEWYHADDEGRFQREQSVFRDFVRADGSSRFPAQAGRYHLYASLACPWASRALLMRRLKGLEGAISTSIVHPHMGEQGWEFRDAPGSSPDTVNGSRYLYEVYVKARPDYSGRVVVPVLWDKQTSTIVSNESRDVLRMFDCEFDAVAERKTSYCPASLRAAVDREIDELYAPVNNGVYSAGFSVSQKAYDEAVTRLFAALDRYEQRLERQRYLLGGVLTEADICLFTTLFRFDAVYHYHFKCNLRRLRDYPNLWGFVRDLYQRPEIGSVCDLWQIKQHYYTSHPMINPTAIVPLGPDIDFAEPHDRARLGED
jgi:glutathionyl-hydroquinone reductase